MIFAISNSYIHTYNMLINYKGTEKKNNPEETKKITKKNIHTFMYY